MTNAASPCSVTQGNDAQIIPHSLSSVVLGEEEERQRVMLSVRASWCDRVLWRGFVSAPAVTHFRSHETFFDKGRESIHPLNKILKLTEGGFFHG